MQILVMDEATASIDHTLDQKIQIILKKEFRDATVMTIAHRIDTIIDSDKVLVMSAGNMSATNDNVYDSSFTLNACEFSCLSGDINN